MKSQVEHPGQKIFQVNKKILKKQALEELSESMNDVQNRQYMILETIIGLKEKVSKDVSKMRVDSALHTNSKRTAMRIELQKYRKLK